MKQKKINQKLMHNILDRVYNGSVSVFEKIRLFVNVRANLHGCKRLQNKCNRYLTKLYEAKYEMLAKGEV